MSQAVAQGCKPTSILLVGNPNVGKSVVFGALSKTYVTVANYPGTTVEICRAKAKALPGTPALVDTPGANSLIPQSEDERVTRDLLLQEPQAPVIQVGDMKNLRRSLYLTLQLAELGRHQILVLNLQDEARDLGISVDKTKLEVRLGVPVLTTTAIRQRGLDQIAKRLQDVAVPRLIVSYPEVVENAIADVASLLPPDFAASSRGIALMLLSGDETLLSWLGSHLDGEDLEKIGQVRADLERQLGQRIFSVIAKARYRAVEEVIRDVYHADHAILGSWRDRLGGIAMDPVWGHFILLLVLVSGYWFVGVFGAQVLVDVVEEGVFGRFINPWAEVLAKKALGPGLLTDALVGKYGLVSMALTYALAIVFPVVSTFFIFFGLLEDSGYLPRLAVMLNRVFKIMGLNGKAVLPMVLGLGCDTMATLTTRILPSLKERVLVTLLLALGVPCSAQLGVLLAMLAGLSLAGTLVWCAVVAGTLVGVGWAAARLLPGRSSDFLLEIPPLRVPRLGNILVKTAARTEWYLREAVPLFILGTLILFTFDATGLLSILEAGAQPLVTGLLGLPKEAASVFLVGFLRRDYGAAGFFALRQGGLLDGVQTVVGLVVITLFVPCVANLLVMIKERGLAIAMGMVAFIVPFAFGIGALVNLLLRLLQVHL